MTQYKVYLGYWKPGLNAPKEVIDLMENIKQDILKLSPSIEDHEYGMILTTEDLDLDAINDIISKTNGILKKHGKLGVYNYDYDFLLEFAEFEILNIIKQ